MLNIVIPMAGKGSHFTDAGYRLPKPLIDIKGQRMIGLVVKNLTPDCSHRFLFLCLEEHITQFHLREYLEEIAPGCVVIPVRKVTEGAACTVLLAEEYINNDNRLMIVNSDQYIDYDVNTYLCAQGDNDGLIMTLTANDNRWSYIACDQEGYVTLVREKEVISSEATVGVYNFRHGRDYVRYARKMIARGLRVNGEYYVAPVYNLMIEEQKKVVFHNVGRVDREVFCLGRPEDVEAFLEVYDDRL
ncbi:MAG: glycosyltransferase family 2 protein [Clostridiales bacterium]|nr:glycosyltransferase family 2 protein [Clostridiales bacterium]